MAQKVTLELEADLEDLKIAFDELKEDVLLEFVKSLCKDMEAESLDKLETYIQTLEG